MLDFVTFAGTAKGNRGILHFDIRTWLFELITESGDCVVRTPIGETEMRRLHAITSAAVESYDRHPDAKSISAVPNPVTV